MKLSDWLDIADNEDLVLRVGPTATWGDEAFGDEGINVAVVAMGYSTYSPGTGTGDDIVEILLYDHRIYHHLKMAGPGGYNVQKAGLGVEDDDTMLYYELSLQGGVPWTWSTVFSGNSFIGLAVDADALPSWTPRNFIFDENRQSEFVDRIAEQLILIPAWDWEQDDPSGSDYYSLYDPEQIRPENLVSSLFGEGSAFSRDSLNKQHIKSVMQDPVAIAIGYFLVGSQKHLDPFSSPCGTRYYERADGDVGGSGPYELVVHFGYYFAHCYGSPDAVQNNTELQGLTTALIPRIRARLAADVSEHEFAGIWPYKLDGYFRVIRWQFNIHGVKTMVRINTDKGFEVPLLETVQETPRIVGVAGTEIVKAIDKYSMAMGGRLPAQVFPGVIASVSGATPNFLYGAKAEDDRGTIHTTPVAPDNAPVTILDVAPANVGDPCLLYYRDGELKIWLIETIDHATCPASYNARQMQNSQVQYALDGQRKALDVLVRRGFK
jgi:hypothetical protein